MVSSLSQYIAVNVHKRDKGIGYLPLRVLSQKMEEKNLLVLLAAFWVIHKPTWSKFWVFLTSPLHLRGHFY